MTTGEIKGYLLQLKKRKTTSPEEKLAVQYAIDALEVMVSVEPIISKVNREIMRDARNSANVTDSSGSRPEPEPNTGWVGDHLLSEGEGS